MKKWLEFRFPIVVFGPKAAFWKKLVEMKLWLLTDNMSEFDGLAHFNSNFWMVEL